MIFFRNRAYRFDRPARLLSVLGVLLLLSGCGVNLKEYYFGDLFGGKGAKTIDKTAEQMAIEGMQKLQKKDYGAAAENFKKLKEHYPYSKYVILAELKLGDAYFYDGKYSEASMSYEEFVRLHPRNEVIPYVLYQVGMCHFLMFTTVDRDAEETKIAMEAFQKVMQNYPRTEYAGRSERQLMECKKRIVAHEMGVARFYYIIKEYPAAKNRLDAITSKYPQAIADMGYGKDVDKMLAKCEAEIAKGPKGPGIWTRMGF